jgi:hypothetical protein
MISISHLPTTIPVADFYLVGAASPSALANPEMKLFPYWDYSYFIPDDAVDWLDELTWAESGGGPWSYRYDCPVSRHHETHRWYNSHVYAILRGTRKEIPPFVSTIDPVPLINADLAKRLRQSKLTGFEVRWVELDRINSGRQFDDELYFLSGPVPMPYVVRRINPKINNECPYCRYRPYFCPTCGYFESRCPQCGKCGIQNTADENDPEERMRFDTNEVYPNEFNPLPRPVIDLARCEPRVDFSGTATFSRRALEFLIEANAYPLQIQPRLALFENETLGYTRDDAVPLADHAKRTNAVTVLRKSL